MPDRTSATETHHEEDCAEAGYFAALASARHLLLATFKPAGGQLAVSVDGLVDGDRATRISIAPP
jgi:hypothetical protein